MKLYYLLLLLAISCSDLRVAKQNIIHKLQNQKLIGTWRFHGAFCLSSKNCSLIPASSVLTINNQGQISLLLRGVDRRSCNEFPNVDPFDKCKSNLQYSGTIIATQDDALEIETPFWNQTLEIASNKDKSWIEVEDITLFKSLN